MTGPHRSNGIDGPDMATSMLSAEEADRQKRAQAVQSTPAVVSDPLKAAAERLKQAVDEGASEADLARLVAELAVTTGHPLAAVQKIADGLKFDHSGGSAVAAEAASIRAEADRKEIGQQLTPRFLLPAVIADAIEVTSQYLPCDGPSAVLPFLTAVAGLVKLGAQVEGSAVAGYRVPINIFACQVGRSGAKKSPTSKRLVNDPMVAIVSELSRSNIRERQDWEQACTEIRKGDPRPPEPRPKRVVVTDFTGEALADQLQTQEAAGLGLLVNRDELSGLFGSLNAYRGGRGGDEQQLLELFDGGGFHSLRVGGGRHYSRSQLSIWGSTQLEVLRELVANGDATGLWARFMFVPLPERAVPLPIAATPAEVARANTAQATLSDTYRAVYAMPPRIYRLTPPATERFVLYEYSRQKAALSTSIGAQSALYGKSAGKVLRLAGALHLLQLTVPDADPDGLIDDNTIDRAIALVDHLDAWALSLHAEAANGSACPVMRTVHRVAEAVGGPIRWKELTNSLSTKQRKEITPAAAAAAMQALADAGYGEVEPGKRGSLHYRATRPLP